MKILLCVLIVNIVFSTYIYSQDPFIGATCSTEFGIDTISYPLINLGGQFITSEGTLRILVIYVRFIDDSEPGSNWPDPNTLPEWAQHLVDQDYNVNGNYTPGRLSQYFYQNSYGKLHVIGDIYYLTTDYPESYYHSFGNENDPDADLRKVTVEILQKLDGIVDYTQYDNWIGQNFNCQPGQDGIMDMVWLITRNIHDDLYADPNKKMSRGWAGIMAPVDLILDGIKFNTLSREFGLGAGFGISIFAKTLNLTISPLEATDGAYTFINGMAHEITHHFMGGGHFGQIQLSPWIRDWYGPSSSSLRSHANGWWGNYSGYERMRLGWLTPTILDVNSDNVILYDLATTTDPLKNRLLKIPIDGTNQYLLIENRSHLSSFETRFAPESNNPNAVMVPGLLIYHIIEEASTANATKVKMLCADGKFTWKVISYGPNPYNDSDDEIEKDYPNALNGYDEREIVMVPGYPIDESKTFNKWKIQWIPNIQSPTGGGCYRNCTNLLDIDHVTKDYDGDKYDLFEPGDVITPWSNPGSHMWAGDSYLPTTIGIEVVSQDPMTKAYTLSIRLSNPETLKPSKPQWKLLESNPFTKMYLIFATGLNGLG